MKFLILIFSLLAVTPITATAQETEYLYFSNVKPGVEPVLEILARQHGCRPLPFSNSEIWILECPADIHIPAIPSVYQWRMQEGLHSAYRNGQSALTVLAESETMPERMGALRYLVQHPRAWRDLRTSPDFTASIRNANETLAGFLAVADAIEGDFKEPMHRAYADTVIRLEKVHTDDTDQLQLLHAARPKGPFVPQARLSHLRALLKWWGTRIEELNALPESASWERLKPEHWRGTDFKTQFRYLGLTGRTFTVEQRTPERAATLFLSDEDPTWALSVLGTPESAAAQTEILNFITTKDAIVQKNLGKHSRTLQFAEFTRRLNLKDRDLELARKFFLSYLEAEDLSTQQANVWRQWETVRQSISRDESLSPSLGHRLLYRLIEGLRKPGKTISDNPDFSPQTYAAAVYDILTVLIRERRERLFSQASYLAALDTAIGWQERMRANPANRAVLRSKGMRARDEALTRAIRQALIEPLPRLPKAACEVLLSPQEVTLR